MKTEQLKLIREAYERMSWQFDSSYRNYARELLEQCEHEERGHRGSGPDFRQHHTADTIGIKDAARLFAVRDVAAAIIKPSTYERKDYLHLKRSCFIAAGIADEFGAKIAEAWKAAGLDIHQIAAMDYCEFVKVKAS